MSEPLFDLSSEYDAMLNQGLRLSGEDRRFFIEGRVRYLVGALPPGFAPRRILDFGCGLGDTTSYLARTFPGAILVGVDESHKALAHALRRFGSHRVRFGPVAEMRNGAFDLVYVNGVFHHVDPENRTPLLAMLRKYMAPGGVLALFENNPWNVGARMVMKRIPFDRDAIMISPRQLLRMLGDAGFRQPAKVRSLFFFPKPLAWCRKSEGLLGILPLGAQYCALASVSGHGTHQS